MPVPQEQFWVVVPAAGSGRRMQSDRPKQYLLLDDKTLLEHTLLRLLDSPRIVGLVLVLAADDPYWSQLPLSQNARIQTVVGGAERSDSVLQGLDKLNSIIDANDWVMVHDAARPCLTQTDLNRLMDAIQKKSDGWVLGAPVRDTMKKTGPDAAIESTLDREQLWHAFTPQMFRLRQLRGALQLCAKREYRVTDEASAMEQAGFHPQMLAGDEHNIKVTRAQDLTLARLILTAQREEAGQCV